MNGIETTIVKLENMKSENEADPIITHQEEITKPMSMAMSMSTQNSPQHKREEEDEDESPNGEINTGRWTKNEHELFLEALTLYGKDWKKVQRHVGTRTTTQARSHAQKYFGKIEREDKKIPDEDEESFPIPLKTEANEGFHSATPEDEFLEELPTNQCTPCKSPQAKSPKSPNRKRLKGPFKPGKRPIKCDSCVPNKEIKERKRLKTEDLPDLALLSLDNVVYASPIPQEEEMEKIMRPMSVSGEFFNYDQGDFVPQVPLEEGFEPELELDTIKPLKLFEEDRQEADFNQAKEDISERPVGIDVSGSIAAIFDGIHGS